MDKSTIAAAILAPAMTAAATYGGYQVGQQQETVPIQAEETTGVDPRYALPSPVQTQSDEAGVTAYNTVSQARVARVLNVRPVMRTVQVAEPRQVCKNVPVTETVDSGNNPITSTTGQTVIGGLLGAVAGNQIGDGRGREIATVAGGVLGAAIGNWNGKRVNNRKQVTYREVCETVNDVRNVEEQDGYDVTYQYGGQVFNRRMQHHPGDQFVITPNGQPDVV